MISNIQGLRFIAAFGVCILHCGILNGELPGFLMGGAGVDLFFVISGFIMVVSSQSMFGQAGAPGKFLYRRITRVVPLYWLAALTYIALLIHVQALSLTPPTPDVYPRAIAGLFFIPLTTKAFAPYLPIGWTLNFEMLFYLIFACAIRFQLGQRQLTLDRFQSNLRLEFSTVPFARYLAHKTPSFSSRV